MIHVMLILFIAGSAQPNISFKENTEFATAEACKAKLPEFAADFVTNAQKNGQTWGADYMFALQCVKARSTDDGKL